MSKKLPIDVLIVSYRGDLEWFRWSTALLEKNLTGHRRIHVVCPKEDEALFREIVDTRKRMELHPVPDWPGKGYYWQQARKMEADLFTDAAIIAHLDSDVFISKPTKITDFIEDGKPAWLWATNDSLPENARVWRAPTERATGLDCPRDYMCGFPFMVDRRTYAVCRKHIEDTHGRKADQFIEECAHKPGQPPGFSEFNFMGRIAWEKQRELYHWVDRNSEEWPDGFHNTKQFWSHSKLADCMPEIQQMLHGGGDPMIRTTRMGIWVLSNDTHISKWVEQEDRLDHDHVTLQRICRHIKPGDTVVDVGAFIGDHTIAYARATHGVDSGMVIAFEPNKAPFECLSRNMAGLSHVECINKGLSDMSEKHTLISDRNAGASYLQKGGDIETITLDSLGLKRLDFMKIDAEGMELKVLKGAEKTIAANKPTMYIEVNSAALARAGTSPGELLGWLRDHGYDVSGVEEGPQYDVLCKHQSKLKKTPVVVVLGVSHKEVDLARLWIRWVSHLCRQPGGDNSQHKLIVFVNRRTTDEQCRSMMNEIGDVRDGAFRFLIACPDDEQEAGYPGSASHLFARALEHVEKHFPGHATLWCEADTVPMRPTWFQEIVSEYQACGKPFMGGQAGEQQFRHMTGNAVYPPDWRTLAPSIMQSFKPGFSTFWINGSGEPWDVFCRHEIMPQMHLCETIQQIWRPEVFKSADKVLPRTALFHQCKDGSLIDILAKRYPGFTPPGTQEGFTLSGRHTGISIAGRDFDFTPCYFSPGLGWVSAYVPANYYEELALRWAVNQKKGVDAIPVDDARAMIAKRSRLPSPQVNTLRL